MPLQFPEFRIAPTRNAHVALRVVHRCGSASSEVVSAAAAFHFASVAAEEIAGLEMRFICVLGPFSDLRSSRPRAAP